MNLGVCAYCTRLLELRPDGTVPFHDQAGPVIRQMTGKRRRRCPGSGKQPRRVEP